MREEGGKGGGLFLLREEILRGVARIGEFFREKNRGNGEEQLQPRLSRYASSYSRCFYPYSISPFGFF